MALLPFPPAMLSRREFAPARFGMLLLAASVLLADSAIHVDQANAEAALAVGLPADLAKGGIAIGWANNQTNKKAAEAEALRRCRELKDVPQATRDLCRIVESFEDRCVAVALDPDAGTTGVGWAVADSQGAAEHAAMEDCVQSSGPKRRNFCRIALARCDGQ